MGSILVWCYIADYIITGLTRPTALGVNPGGGGGWTRSRFLKYSVTIRHCSCGGWRLGQCHSRRPALIYDIGRASVIRSLVNSPARTTHLPNIEPMLAHRLRRRPNICPTLGRWVVFAGRWSHNSSMVPSSGGILTQRRPAVSTQNNFLNAGDRLWRSPSIEISKVQCYIYIRSTFKISIWFLTIFYINTQILISSN